MLVSGEKTKVLCRFQKPEIKGWYVLKEADILDDTTSLHIYNFKKEAYVPNLGNILGLINYKCRNMEAALLGDVETNSEKYELGFVLYEEDENDLYDDLQEVYSDDDASIFYKVNEDKMSVYRLSN